MSIVLGPNQYGKAENRVVRIYRDQPRHEIRDLNVSTALRGDFSAAHRQGDQSHVLPTDTRSRRSSRTPRRSGWARSRSSPSHSGGTS
jgi:urate oxidase